MSSILMSLDGFPKSPYKEATDIAIDLLRTLLDWVTSDMTFILLNDFLTAQ